MKQLTRRNAILGAIGTGAVALAGCVSDTGSEENDDDGAEDEQAADGPETTELESSVERVGSDCAGMGPGEVTVFLDEETYVVQGTIPSPTPCYEPVIESHAFDDGTLSLTIDVTASGDGPCMDCNGEVMYDATISGVDREQVDRVSVTHTGGKTHDTPADEIPEGLPELVEAEITDSGSQPRDSEEDGSVDIGEIDDSGETGTITITGRIPTENPHHEAVLDAASVRAGTLSLTVSVESTLEDDRMGTMPLGVVEYTAVAEIEHPGGIDSVQIQHPQSSYGGSWASDSAAASESETGSDSGSASDGSP